MPIDGITMYDAAGMQIYALSDGVKDFAPDVFSAVTAADLDARLAAAGETTIRTSFNAFLIRQGGDWTLVDTGCGGLFGAVGGHLPQRLMALGVQPDQIGCVLFTHLHGDHCGGALVAGQAAYPKAKVLMHAAELAYWRHRDAPAGRVIAALQDRIDTITDDQEIAPGLRVWALPGHTPGHIGLRCGAEVVIVGDIFHAAALQLSDPDLATIYDVDPALATTSRHAALAEIAARDLVFTGGHAVGPHVFARLRRMDRGYKAVAA